MAKHLAPEKEKKTKKRIRLPEIDTEALPRVVDFRFGQTKKRYLREFSLRAMIPVLAAALLFLVGFLLRGPAWVKLLLLGASALCSAFDLLRRCLIRIVNKKLPDEGLLFLIAAAVAFGIGEYAAGAFSLLMIRAGELTQGYVLARCDRGVDQLRRILPGKAVILRGEEAAETLPENVAVGDVLRVEAGECVPVDGEVLSGESRVDRSALTGEEDAIEASAGSKLRSGFVNLDQPLTMRAEKSFADSAAALRLTSFEQARAMDSILETRLNRCAAIFTPAAAVCALLLGVILPLFTGDWTGCLRRAGGCTSEIAAGVTQLEEIPGRGVSAFFAGRHVYVVNAALMHDHGITFQTPTRAGSAIHVAVDSAYWGHILLSDKLRDGAFDAVEDLRAQGVEQMVMLTGDVISVSKNIAAALNFDMVRSELSPEGKLSALHFLMQGLGERGTLAYVGDGIHDAPLFDAAQVGIAMDALRFDDGVDKADVCVMSGEIRRLPQLQHIVATAWHAVRQNIILCYAVKALLLILAAFDAVPVSIAAASDALVTVLTALNSLRCYTVE